MISADYRADVREAVKKSTETAHRTMSAPLFDGRVSPDSGQMLVDETVKTLKEIK